MKEMKSLKDLSDFTMQSKDEVKRRTVADELYDLNFFGEKIIINYDKTLKIDNVSDKDSFIDAMFYNVNNYAEVLLNLFRVLVLTHVPPIKIPNTLLRLFDFFIENYGIRFSDNVAGILDFLKQRNVIIHEYNNYELNITSMLDAMKHYSDGIEELTKLMETIIDEENLLDFEIRSEKLGKKTVGLGK